MFKDINTMIPFLAMVLISSFGPNLPSSGTAKAERLLGIQLATDLVFLQSGLNQNTPRGDGWDASSQSVDSRIYPDRLCRAGYPFLVAAAWCFKVVSCACSAFSFSLIFVCANSSILHSCCTLGSVMLLISW